MRLHATRLLRTVLGLALFTAPFVFAGGPAQAQINPLWDHYKAYLAQPHIQHIEQMTLIDQFHAETDVLQYLDFFANPVEKRHGAQIYPINHPELHYTWWAISQHPFAKDVIATNQFGEQLIHIGQSAYLLAPALKNTASGVPLPYANHYKCYECSGDPVNVTVTLTDQFLTRSAVVVVPRFFCAPAEKRLLNGLVYPMVDPSQHYVVYDMDYTTQIYGATIQDQFIPNTNVELNIDRLLMVPSLKSFPTEAGSHTWGKLRSLYR